MTAIPTRTLNPLPFQDLEPHRFEDMIRQLAYDLRRWKSLEATGRSGSDEGVDIRAIEIVYLHQDPDDDDDVEPVIEERLWSFQCKREKKLSPTALRKVIKESLASYASPPYGFVLAVACDISKKARDAFREEMVTRGIEEFEIWAKSELEDKLFQPKNDRLLFAYFGISLQPRRIALSTSLRSQIAKKKQLNTLLDGEKIRGKLVLLRDPNDERYPHNPKEGESSARWLACWAISTKKPGRLVVLHQEFLAATTPDGSAWDAIFEYVSSKAKLITTLRSLHSWLVNDHYHSDQTPHNFWYEYIAEQDRAILKVYKSIPLERILAIDLLGDGYYPVPQLFVEFDDKSSPFIVGEHRILEREGRIFDKIKIDLSDNNRVEIFPKPLPSDLDLPPSGFDVTSNQTITLSDTTQVQLKAILDSVRDDNEAQAAKSNTPNERVDQNPDKISQFREWRDTVAIPLFSTFVESLRTEGHHARINIRSVDSSVSPGNGFESVELRIHMRISVPYNTEYRAAGHIRISISEHRGWDMSISPLSSESRSNRPSPATPKVESLQKVQLEEQVLIVLGRLQDQSKKQ